MLYLAHSCTKTVLHQGTGEFTVNVDEVNQQRFLEESEQWFENVD